MSRSPYFSCAMCGRGSKEVRLRLYELAGEAVVVCDFCAIAWDLLKTVQ